MASNDQINAIMTVLSIPSTFVAQQREGRELAASVIDALGFDLAMQLAEQGGVDALRSSAEGPQGPGSDEATARPPERAAEALSPAEQEAAGTAGDAIEEFSAQLGEAEVSEDGTTVTFTGSDGVKRPFRISESGELIPLPIEEGADSPFIPLEEYEAVQADTDEGRAIAFRAFQRQYFNQSEFDDLFGDGTGSGSGSVGATGLARGQIITDDQGNSFVFDGVNLTPLNGPQNFAGIDPERTFAQSQQSLDDLNSRAGLAASTTNFGTITNALPNFGQFALNQTDLIREILSTGSDFLTRAFLSRGEESPFPEVTQADIINRLREAVMGINAAGQSFQQQTTPQSFASATGSQATAQPAAQPEAEPEAEPPAPGTENVESRRVVLPDGTVLREDSPVGSPSLFDIANAAAFSGGQQDEEVAGGAVPRTKLPSNFGSRGTFTDEEVNFAHGGKTQAKRFIVGDPQVAGVPNPELVEVTASGTKVTPLRNFAHGTNYGNSRRSRLRSFAHGTDNHGLDFESTDEFGTGFTAGASGGFKNKAGQFAGQGFVDNFGNFIPQSILTGGADASALTAAGVKNPFTNLNFGVDPVAHQRELQAADAANPQIASSIPANRAAPQAALAAEQARQAQRTTQPFDASRPGGVPQLDVVPETTQAELQANANATAPPAIQSLLRGELPAPSDPLLSGRVNGGLPTLAMLQALTPDEQDAYSAYLSAFQISLEDVFFEAQRRANPAASSQARFVA